MCSYYTRIGPNYSSLWVEHREKLSQTRDPDVRRGAAWAFRHACGWSWGRYLFVAFDRQIRPRAPFRPGAVIEAPWRLAERFKREGQDRSGHTRAAGGDDRLVEIDAGGGEYFGDPLARHQPAVLQKLVKGHVERTRHVTGAQAGPRLRRLAGKARRRTGVDDLHAAVGKRQAYLVEQRDGADIHGGIECLRRALGLGGNDRASFGFP